MSNSRRWIVVLIIMNALLLAATASLLFSQLGPVAEPRMVTPRGDLGADERATIDLFRNARESVVFISTRQRVADFWTRNVYSVPRGSGSGLVWDGAGHIVTNFHVIEGASEAQIQLADGRQFSATLVGVSSQLDLAVLKIGGAGFTAPARVPIGTSSDLQVGQNVFAIGNPFGLDWTLTKGIVSALDRSLPNENGPDIRHLIQTDAAINPGNSGGPLLNLRGEVIGIDTAMAQGAENIGFALPINKAKRAIESVRKSGKISYPFLGVRYIVVNKAVQEEKKLPVDYGALVTGDAENAAVVKGGSAEKAGLKEGDIILEIGGIRVDAEHSLASLIQALGVGETISLKIMRNGKEMIVSVTLAERK